MIAGELDSTSEKQRQLVLTRSGQRCEAQVRVDTYVFEQREPQPIWTRCFSAVYLEVHHMLPRSRGGVVLDEAGETYHLVAMCNQHHRLAHAQQEEFMIDGSVVTGAHGRPVYRGQDPVLSQKYPA